MYPMAQVLLDLHKEGYEERYRKNRTHQKKIGIYRMIETILFTGIISFGAYLYITYRLKVEGISTVAAYVAMVSAVAYIVTCIGGCTRAFFTGRKTLYVYEKHPGFYGMSG
ncbi:MAG: hypothetical protein K2K54_11515 [Lachnospiraceae bacterium]|nr:hypothetical protein [Lachnospiraceae bacterium]